MLLHFKIVHLLQKMHLVLDDCRGVCNGITLEGARAFFSNEMETFKQRLKQIDNANSDPEIEALLQNDDIRKFLIRIEKYQNPNKLPDKNGLHLAQNNLPELIQATEMTESTALNDSKIVKINSCNDFCNREEKLNYGTALPLVKHSLDYAKDMTKASRKKSVIILRGYGNNGGHGIFYCVDEHGHEELWDANTLLSTNEQDDHLVTAVFNSLQKNVRSGPVIYCQMETYIQFPKQEFQHLPAIQRQLILSSQRYKDDQYNRNQEMLSKKLGRRDILNWVIHQLKSGASIDTLESALDNLLEQKRTPHTPSPIRDILPAINDICFVLYQLDPTLWQNVLPFFLNIALLRQVGRNAYQPTEDYLNIEALLTKFSSSDWKNLFDAFGESFVTFLHDDEQKTMLKHFYFRLSESEQEMLLNAMGDRNLQAWGFDRSMQWSPTTIAAPIHRYAQSQGFFHHHRERAAQIARTLADPQRTDTERKAIITNQKHLMQNNDTLFQDGDILYSPPAIDVKKLLGHWAFKMKNRPKPKQEMTSRYYQALCDAESLLDTNRQKKFG